MKKLFLLLGVFVFTEFLFAQNEQNVTASLPASTSSEIGKYYSFNDFTNGIVMYEKGRMGEAELNYSYLLKEMHFLDPDTGSIMAIDKAGVNAIYIDGRTFIPGTKGREFYEQISDGAIFLGVNKIVQVVSVKEKSIPTVVFADAKDNDGYQKISNAAIRNKANKHPSIDEYYIDTDYYLINSRTGKQTLVKNINSYLKAYPNSVSGHIKQYADKNKINFESKEDLITLTDYCNRP